MTLAFPHPSTWFFGKENAFDADPSQPAHEAGARQRPSPANEAQTLFVAIQRDEPGALESLYRLYFDRLTRYAYQITHDDDLSQSLVQDVFVNVWERRTSLAVSGIWDSYLYRSVRNRALKNLRDSHRRARLGANAMSVTGTAPGMGDNVSDIHATLESKELQAMIADALRTLPPRQHEALALRWSHAMSYTDAAAIMNVSEARVRQLVSRAEEQVRAAVLPYLKNS